MTYAIRTAGLLAKGLLAGTAGVAAMTLAEKIEQAVTGRPDSYVPARTLEHLLARPETDRLGVNWAMHWGQGILLGTLRAAMARRGIRGPVGSFIFLNLRLLNDQTLENATGVGAPPWTWPVDEQVVDLLHKAVYAFVTGATADWLIDRGVPSSTDGDSPKQARPGSARTRKGSEDPLIP